MPTANSCIRGCLPCCASGAADNTVQPTNVNRPEVFENSDIVWCIDLDGTLIYEDVTTLAIKGVLREGSLQKITRSLLHAFKGCLKSNLRPAQVFLETSFEVDVTRLTYNPTLLELIKTHRQRGGKVVLATAADETAAKRVAEHLQGVFHEVIASDGDHIKRSRRKATALNERFGKNNYIYAGNSSDDLNVWKDASAMLVVNTSKNVCREALKMGKPYMVIK
ncbi:hypothetical protein CYMTET_56301 [Cymbomonas tetramitiformis]|uniref:Uncharacterized protein n=1 Tax=Cymbomonas tetramitiformis TaxID=36881 RepID=A0AAE0BBJ4_9CHLO|nr:hypothetical protein CYMTET_56301 [Cymbomonas tetramitiformis]|eukprot:gene15373-18188_t